MNKIIKFLDELGKYNFYINRNYNTFINNIHYDNEYIFYQALEYNRTDVILYMLENGTDINEHGLDVISYAISHGDICILKYATKRGIKPSNNDLRWIVKFNYFQSLKYFVKNGADINIIFDEIIKHPVNNSKVKVIKYITKTNKLDSRFDDMLRKLCLNVKYSGYPYRRGLIRMRCGLWYKGYFNDIGDNAIFYMILNKKLNRNIRLKLS